MSKQAIQPESVTQPTSPLSPVVVSRDLVFVSGQGPFVPGGRIVADDFAQQARQVFENLSLCLAAAGCGFEDVLRIGAFLADLHDFDAYNEIYREFFKPPYPARTTVEARLLGIRIEIDAMARRPS